MSAASPLAELTDEELTAQLQAVFRDQTRDIAGPDAATVLTAARSATGPARPWAVGVAAAAAAAAIGVGAALLTQRPTDTLAQPGGDVTPTPTASTRLTPVPTPTSTDQVVLWSIGDEVVRVSMPTPLAPTDCPSAWDVRLCFTQPSIGMVGVWLKASPDPAATPVPGYPQMLTAASGPQGVTMVWRPVRDRWLAVGAADASAEVLARIADDMTVVAETSPGVAKHNTTSYTITPGTSGT